MCSRLILLKGELIRSCETARASFLWAGYDVLAVQSSHFAIQVEEYRAAPTPSTRSSLEAVAACGIEASPVASYCDQ